MKLHCLVRCPILSLVLLATLALGSARAEPVPDAAALKALSARLAPVELGADLRRLAPGERRALARILEALDQLAK